MFPLLPQILLNFTTENRIFSTKCPICYVTDHDVIVRMSSKDSCVQFGTCFPTLVIINPFPVNVPILYPPESTRKPGTIK